MEYCKRGYLSWGKNFATLHVGGNFTIGGEAAEHLHVPLFARGQVGCNDVSIRMNDKY